MHSHMYTWAVLGVVDLFVVPLPFYLVVFTCTHERYIYTHEASLPSRQNAKGSYVVTCTATLHLS